MITYGGAGPSRRPGATSTTRRHAATFTTRRVYIPHGNSGRHVEVDAQNGRAREIAPERIA